MFTFANYQFLLLNFTKIISLLLLSSIYTTNTFLNFWFLSTLPQDITKKLRAIVTARLSPTTIYMLEGVLIHAVQKLIHIQIWTIEIKNLEKHTYLFRNEEVKSIFKWEKNTKTAVFRDTYLVIHWNKHYTAWNRTTVAKESSKKK